VIIEEETGLKGTDLLVAMGKPKETKEIFTDVIKSCSM